MNSTPAAAASSLPAKSRADVILDVYIHSVFKTGDTHALQKAVTSKTDTSFFTKEHLTQCDNNGNMLIHLACANGHPDLLAFLLRKVRKFKFGFKFPLSSFVNFSNNNREFPLFLTASPKTFEWDKKSGKVVPNRDMLDVVRLLLENGAFFCEEMNHKKWMHIYAHYPIEFFRLILMQPEHSDLFYVEHEAKDVAKDELPWGRYSKADIVQSLMQFVLSDVYVDRIVTVFFEKYEADNTDEYLKYVIARKHSAITFCLQQGADPWLLDCPAISPYLIAVRNSDRLALFLFLKDAIETGDIEKIRLVLDSGALPINYTDSVDGDTPLHVACAHPSPRRNEIIQLLLDRGAIPYIRNNAGRTAKNIAEKNDIDTRMFPPPSLEGARKALLDLVEASNKLQSLKEGAKAVASEESSLMFSFDPTTKEAKIVRKPDSEDKQKNG